MNLTIENAQAWATEQDKNDPLSSFREKFHIPPHPNDPSQDSIYFSGNSLGLQPKSTSSFIQQELDDWAKMGVVGHVKSVGGWLHYHELVTEQLAKIVGAKNREVVAMNTLTVNLNLLLVSFYRPTPQKYKIIIEKGTFPSDVYAFKSHLKYHGYPESGLIELTPREGEETLRTEDILQTLEDQKDEIAIVVLGGINYLTGQVFDMQAISEKAHQLGITFGVDLAHAVGNVPLQLHDWGVDFACWCSYKYLNSGPGGIGGIFVHEKNLEKNLHRFSGWWGHDKNTRFDMGPDFHPIASAEGWQMSNPPIFSLASLRASLEIFAQTDMQALRKKSLAMTSFLHFLFDQELGELVSFTTPREEAARGSQVSLKIDSGGEALKDRLKAKGVISDWRLPNILRIAPVPLYNSFTDIYRFSQILKGLLQEK